MSAPAQFQPRLRASRPPSREAVAPILPEPSTSPDVSEPDVQRRARELGIPWERILREEIKAEETLRRYLADTEKDWPVWSAMAVLPLSFLHSWRLRDRIQALACQARAAAAPAALRQLRQIFQRLTGKSSPAAAALAEHLWFAYERVLLLQRVSRAAVRSRGSTPERLAFVCSRTGCCFDDAAWAVCQEESPQRGYRLDAAVRKAREEGFQIPRAGSEARAFSELRGIVRSSPHLARRRHARRAAHDVSRVPRPLALPVDAV